VLSAGKRLVTVIESTALTQNTALHVVKIGDQYFAIGGGTGHLSLLTELPAETVEPWMEAHRRALAGQAQSLTALLGRLRRPHA
jgi:flagellar biogenesis protein FliO